jgi:activating signal cointegrator 1
MKAITLTQPWATLIAIGAKMIETRGWSTAHRGRLAIHAGQGLGPVGGKAGLLDLCCEEPFLSVLHKAGYTACAYAGRELPRGSIVAVCRLVDSASLTTQNGKAYRWNEPTLSWVRVPELEASFGDYSEGRYGFVLADVRALPEPIPAKGALQLWDWQPPEGFTL